MTLNSTNKNTLKAIALVFLILWAFTHLRTSKYQPVDVETSDEGSLFDLPSTKECLKDSYYSDSRGGVCGGQKLVAAQAGYKMK